MRLFKVQRRISEPANSCLKLTSVSAFGSSTGVLMITLAGRSAVTTIQYRGKRTKAPQEASKVISSTRLTVNSFLIDSTLPRNIRA